MDGNVSDFVHARKHIIAQMFQISFILNVLDRLEDAFEATAVGESREGAKKHSVFVVSFLILIYS